MCKCECLGPTNQCVQTLATTASFSWGFAALRLLRLSSPTPCAVCNKPVRWGVGGNQRSLSRESAICLTQAFLCACLVSLPPHSLSVPLTKWVFCLSPQPV